MAENEGWHFEGADPESGLTDTVIHEDCSLRSEDNFYDDEPEVTSDTRNVIDGTDLVNVITTWTCQCGAITETRETYPRSYFEEA